MWQGLRDALNLRLSGRLSDLPAVTVAPLRRLANGLNDSACVNLTVVPEHLVAHGTEGRQRSAIRS
eukprot:294006-Alexandrium_andersonii.AAC.1